ncbi:hypothetical protein ACM66B_005140 [Microbotryomycetes sp. NB124-2]
MLATTAHGVLRAGSRLNVVRLVSTSAPALAAAAETTGAASSTNSPSRSSTTSSSPVPAAFRAPAASTSTSKAFPTFSGESNWTRLRRKSFYKLHVYSTRNNTILTLTHTPGAESFDHNPTDPHHVVAWVSGGSAGFKGASRATYDAAVEASIRMFRKIQNLVNPPVGPGGQRQKVVWSPPTDLEIVWKGFGQGRDAVYRTLMGGQGEAVQRLVTRVTDATPLKIGGTRPKKKRTI